MADYLIKYGILDLIDKYMNDCVSQNKNSLIEVIPKGTRDYYYMQLFLERCSTGFEPKMAILDKERAVIKEYSRYNRIEENSKRKIQHDKIVINQQKNNIRNDGSINKFGHQSKLSDVENYRALKNEQKHSTSNMVRINGSMSSTSEAANKIKAEKEANMFDEKYYQMQKYLIAFEVFKQQLDELLQTKKVYEIDADFLMKNTDLMKLFEIIPTMKLKLEFGIWLKLHLGWSSKYFFKEFSKKVYGLSHETVRRRLVKYDIPYRNTDFRNKENIRKIVSDVENFVN